VQVLSRPGKRKMAGNRIENPELAECQTAH
jgi:hypothetical protein